MWVTLYATSPGVILTYIGHGKFARCGRSHRFGSAHQALEVGHALQNHHAVLRMFKLWAV